MVTLFDDKRSPLLGRKSPTDKAVIVRWKQGRKYKSGKRKVSQKDSIWVNDFGQHIKYGYDIPVEYEDHMMTGSKNNTRSAHIVGDDLVIKYRIEGNIVHLINIGTHKEVYGPTRRFK